MPHIRTTWWRSSRCVTGSSPTSTPPSVLRRRSSSRAQPAQHGSGPWRRHRRAAEITQVERRACRRARLRAKASRSYLIDEPWAWRPMTAPACRSRRSEPHRSWDIGGRHQPTSPSSRWPSSVTASRSGSAGNELDEANHRPHHAQGALPAHRRPDRRAVSRPRVSGRRRRSEQSMTWNARGVSVHTRPGASPIERDCCCTPRSATRLRASSTC